MQGHAFQKLRLHLKMVQRQQHLNSIDLIVSLRAAVKRFLPHTACIVLADPSSSLQCYWNWFCDLTSCVTQSVHAASSPGQASGVRSRIAAVKFWIDG